MQRLVRFFLARTLFETRTLSSKSKFHNFLKLIIVSSFAAKLNNSLHVTTFCSNKSSCYLKLFIVIYLNIKSACVLNVFILCLLLLLLFVMKLLLGWWGCIDAGIRKGSLRIRIRLENLGTSVIIRRLLINIFLIGCHLFLS